MRTRHELLKLLKEAYINDYHYEGFLCYVANALNEDDLISYEERNKIKKYIFNNRPDKSYGKGDPFWGRDEVEARIDFLNKHIELTKPK